jgi:GT2 family glycosyltransferase
MREESMGLDVSVLICTRDRGEMLDATLRSVLACFPAPAEVVVVDQSRDETTRKVVCSHQGGRVPVRYLRGKGTGLSRAKNQGIADCTASVITFTDDDCRVDPGWIGSLSAPLRSGKAEAATGKTLPERPLPGAVETFSVYAPPEGTEFARYTHPWRVGGGGNFAVTREALRRAGEYDERFGPGAKFQSAEDMDMVHRLLRSGTRIVYVPSAVVWHRSWRSPGESRLLSQAYGVGAGAYFTKHLFAGDLLSGWRFLQRFSIRSLHLLRAILRRDRARIQEQSIYLVALFRGAGRFLLTRSPRKPALGRLEGKRA